MKELFQAPLLKYVLIALGIVVFTGVGVFPFIENKVILIIILLTYFVAFLLFLRSFYALYLLPLKKATTTITKMEQGNYRARMHFSTNNEIIEQLMYKINSLARHLSELSIQEKMHSEQLFTLINNSSSGLILIDEKGYIHLVNQQFLDMFGGREKEYKGQIYHNVLREEKFHRIIQQVFLYEKNIKDEFLYYSGIHKRYYEVVGTPIFNKKNRVKGAVLATYDITELKRLEVMRKDFVANVSHELRTPITSITGFAETLLDGGIEDPDAAKEFLSIIHKESKRMQLLIEDLLTLSKLEDENFQLVLNKITLSDLLQEVIPPLKIRAEKKGLALTVQAEEDLNFKADQERIKQIFINLIDNAIHYTPDGGKIDVEVFSTSKYVHLKVSDTGIGITEKELPRIFERFYRVDRARSRNTGGTGLGLAIVKHIVEVHKGNIDIESEVGKGTTVHVYLPK